GRAGPGAVRGGADRASRPTLRVVSVPRPLAVAPLASASHGGALDAEGLFLRLFADAEAAFWLDAGADAAQGWSILGTGCAEADAAAVRAVDLTADRPAPAGAAAEVPFRGGWVGWLSYEEGATVLGAPTAGTDGGSAWIAVTHAVAVHHRTGRVFALAEPERLREWQEQVQAAVGEAAATGAAGTAPADGEAALATARHGVADYADMVEACRAAIERGDAYQLCLTTRFSVPRPADPI